MIFELVRIRRDNSTTLTSPIRASPLTHTTPYILAPFGETLKAGAESGNTQKDRSLTRRSNAKRRRHEGARTATTRPSVLNPGGAPAFNASTPHCVVLTSSSSWHCRFSLRHHLETSVTSKSLRNRSSEKAGNCAQLFDALNALCT
jgi:hypothetical protein